MSGPARAPADRSPLPGFSLRGRSRPPQRGSPGLTSALDRLGRASVWVLTGLVCMSRERATGSAVEKATAFSQALSASPAASLRSISGRG
jgi:hypothetical protein